MIEKAPLCTHCGTQAEATYEMRESGNLKCFWMCRKRVGGKQHKFKKSIVHNSFFKGSKLNLQQLLRIIYCFCKKIPNSVVVSECDVSEAAVVDWYSFLRQVYLDWALSKTQSGKKISGPGKAVEIDESKFGKRKYNMGRLTKGSWVVGGVESLIEIGDWSRVATAKDYTDARAAEFAASTDLAEPSDNDANPVSEVEEDEREPVHVGSMDDDEQAAWAQWEQALVEARNKHPGKHKSIKPSLRQENKTKK